jgi:arylsulfatase A-like enzyme
VIFTSDNGPHKEGGHSPSFFESSGPLRGIKRAMYEGGIRVPFVARWPGGTPAGRTTDMPIAFWDFLPTAAELAGVRSPAGLDGLSYAPALRGEAQKPHEHFYWEFHESGFDQAVRAGNWKAVRGNSAPGTELYDLTADISERNNIAAAHPDVVRRLEGLMNSSRTDSAEFPIRTPAQAKKSALPM